MPQVATTLEARLAPIAETIVSMSYQLLKVRSKVTSEYLGTNDLAHEALTAAFEAFMELGGDIDNVDAFEWDVRRAELVLEAKRTLHRSLVGKQSAFGDVRSRLTERPNRAMCDQDRWDVWSGEALLSSNPTSRKIHGAEYLTEAEQEREFRDNQLAELFSELQGLLTTEEVRWMKAVYWEGHSIAECGRALVASGEYADEKRATNYLYKVLERARKRAAALLAPRWKKLFVEAQ